MCEVCFKVTAVLAQHDAPLKAIHLVDSTNLS